MGGKHLRTSSQAVGTQLFPHLPFFRVPPPHGPKMTLPSLGPGRLSSFRDRHLLPKVSDQELIGLSTLTELPGVTVLRSRLMTPFPSLVSLFFRSTMSSTLPWPGARPTRPVLMGYGPAWCMWSKCVPGL